jgi:hypothetical protein
MTHHNQSPQVEEIRDRVKEFIAHEPEAADFRITIFDAALTSYKRATVSTLSLEFYLSEKKGEKRKKERERNIFYSSMSPAMSWNLSG